jgi:anti-sigma factor RsiW
VSHLGEDVSALVDGELTGAELDRANAHLAACERCCAEAAALRDLKRQLRGLAAAAGTGIGTELGVTLARSLDEAMTERLLAMGSGPGGRQASRRLRRDAGRPRAVSGVYSAGSRRSDGTRRAGSRPGNSRPGVARSSRPQRPGPGHTQRLVRPRLVLPAEKGQRVRARDGRLRLRPRGWHLIWSAVSLVVVGIGAAAFSIGGGTAATPGPRVTPPVEMFSVEHAITSGDVPIPDPTTQVPTAESTP